MQLAGFTGITVVLGQDGRHVLAILPTLPRHWHQKFHGHLGRDLARRDLAIAHFLRDRFRQKLHQFGAVRHRTSDWSSTLVQATSSANLQNRERTVTLDLYTSHIASLLSSFRSDLRFRLVPQRVGCRAPHRASLVR